MRTDVHTIPSKSHSANHAKYKGPLALLFCVLLAGCTVGPWDKAFWNPPSATGIAPITSGPSYPIKRIDGTSSNWPNLGDVPEKPAKPNTEAEQAAAVAALNAQREAAQKLANPSAAPQPAPTLPALPTTPPAPPPAVEFAP